MKELVLITYDTHEPCVVIKFENAELRDEVFKHLNEHWEVVGDNYPAIAYPHFNDPCAMRIHWAVNPKGTIQNLWAHFKDKIYLICGIVIDCGNVQMKYVKSGLIDTTKYMPASNYKPVRPRRD